MTQINLNYNIAFTDLYSRTGNEKIHAKFLEFVEQKNPELHEGLGLLYDGTLSMAGVEESEVIMETAIYVEEFLAELFNIQAEVAQLKHKQEALSNIFSCKRLFVQRRAIKKYRIKDVEQFDTERTQRAAIEILGADFSEQDFADFTMPLLENEQEEAEKLDILARYAAWAVLAPEGKAQHKAGVLFKTPHKIDPLNLVPLSEKNGAKQANAEDITQRQGFAYTNKPVSIEKILDEANYCIFCHPRQKDSCSKGLRDKQGAFVVNGADITLTGCPLEEKISEMNQLKTQSFILAPLAVAIIDNPMVAATGHRICNDCMKGCIYQTQEPVNIPLIESGVLDDVLNLPYGFEIYSLLTRWNPLNFERVLPEEDSHYKILIAGLGPSGFTLAHHLLNEGHMVVGIDGLKIEPLPQELVGNGFQPIKNVQAELYEKLDERVIGGFGGVAEYGITVRWNKNYLKIIRLLLERRANFKLYGGVRFGSQITREIAFEQLGFDHVALCMGAGSPTIINLKNNLARGIRKASDFLMSLQLTGASREDLITNLQIRLPVLVVGGGLTAIDTATEALAYYPVQVEKFLKHYEILVEQIGKEAVEANWSAEEKIIAQEFILHAKELRTEKHKKQPNILSLLKKWGGVKIIYRKKLSDSPAYRLNHEEVEFAFSEGIEFVENITPNEAVLDEYLAVQSLKTNAGELPARTILIAAGTAPNTVASREDDYFQLDGNYFRTIDEDGQPVQAQRSPKPEKVAIFTDINKQGKAISFFGDMHPSFNGNVVKAMASAKRGYPYVSEILQRHIKAQKPTDFFKKLDAALIAKIHQVQRLTPNIIAVTIQAKLASQQFQPGQFYRLQNYEANAQVKNGTKFLMEGLAMTGAEVDREKGLVTIIALEMGGSSDLCQKLRIGEEVVLMGPTGKPTTITANENILLIGGGLGNAVLFSIGQAFRKTGSKVLYFAGYKKAIDRYKIEEIEKASDVLVWACDEESDFQPDRPQDKVFQGNIIEAITAYAKGELGEVTMPLNKINRIIAIGSDRMMKAVKDARISVLQPYLQKDHVAIASINSPMQCMMKEICAQCLQKHIDPITGEESFVYSCFDQDQKMEEVSFSHLNQRLKQNSLQEKMTAEWLKANLD
jgi:NADPH-dependent glutamate synthase beta subunit-like oxidoreductase/NAD(P)H-flavin reductase